MRPSKSLNFNFCQKLGGIDWHSGINTATTANGGALHGARTLKGPEPSKESVVASHIPQMDAQLVKTITVPYIVH